jgi:hypothetical protein
MALGQQALEKQKETVKKLGMAVGLALIALVLVPGVAHAWTPGTHIFLGESVLANLHQLPTAITDLLRAFPYDFLYGNIAADTSMAKKYAPVGRHCHAWHVGQEIFDLAPSDPLRAFGLGYLSHLAVIPSRTTSSCRASSSSPRAPSHSATPTGRAGSKPISAMRTRAKRATSF